MGRHLTKRKMSSSAPAVFKPHSTLAPNEKELESFLASDSDQLITTQSSERTLSPIRRLLRLIVVLFLGMLVLSSLRPLYHSCSRTLSKSSLLTTTSRNMSSSGLKGDVTKAVRLTPNEVKYKLPSGDAIPSVALGTAGKGETYDPVVAGLKAVSHTLHAFSLRFRKCLLEEDPLIAYTNHRRMPHSYIQLIIHSIDVCHLLGLSPS